MLSRCGATYSERGAAASNRRLSTAASHGRGRLAQRQAGTDLHTRHPLHYHSSFLITGRRV
jgi:hypothetical protein